MQPLKALWKDLKAAGKIGLGLALRHPSGWLGQRVHCVPVAGVGPMWARFEDSDASVLRQVFAGRSYDLARYPQQHARVRAALERIVAAGKRPVIVDAGANIGASAVWFALRYPEAMVVAVEPDPANLEIARRNVARFANVVLAPAAIGGQRGMVNVVTLGAGEATRTERGKGGETPILTVADAKALAGPGAELLAVKVDIEGFEADLFAHNLEWIDEISVLMIELHDWMLPGQHSSGPLQRAVLNRGFEMLVRGESVFFIR